MLRFHMSGSLFFKRGKLAICVGDLQDIVDVPSAAEEIWVEFSARPGRHRLECKTLSVVEWMQSVTSCQFVIDGKQVDLCSDTLKYIRRKFGNKTFYVTVYY